MIPFPNKKYKIIYADPPWKYHTGNSGKMRGTALKHYNTMDIKEIEELPVKDISDNDAALFLWVTFPCLKDGLEVMEKWGFYYKTIAFNWVKKSKTGERLFWGNGFWTRSNSEICLLGIKGKPKRINAGVHSVIISNVEQHSKKPDEARKRIVDLMGDISRIELFAREKQDGWDCWGDEVQEMGVQKK